MKNEDKSSKGVIITIIIITIALIAYLLYDHFSHKDNGNNNLIEDAVDIYKDITNENDVDIYSSSYKRTRDNNIKETEIATYTTTIYDQDENRVYNISLANKKLNGYIIKKGEEFSFNNTIGPMGEDMGYRKALGFDANGNHIQIPAGGLCQISSTMYNTALIAGLEIIERHPHSAQVAYVPEGKDATILYGSLDLKFKNTTDSDIKIVATNDDANVTISFVKISN